MTSNTLMIGHERANGVIFNNKFYPYKINTLDDLSSIIRKNTRLYIRGICSVVTVSGIKNSGSSFVTGKLNGQVVTLLYSSTPAQTLASDYQILSTPQVNVGLLFDRETPLVITKSAQHESYVVTLVYAEVDDV